MKLMNQKCHHGIHGNQSLFLVATTGEMHTKLSILMLVLIALIDKDQLHFHKKMLQSHGIKLLWEAAKIESQLM